MKAIIFTALIAVCSSANLDRTYLPPSSAKAAGGSSEILQLPNLPIGSYENDHQGVVVDAAVGTRTSEQSGLSGLGASRISYGSTNSKVGEAAFRDKHLQGGASFLPQGFVDFNRPERVQASRDRVSNIVRLENNLTPDSYNYLYQTDNGISAAEKAVSVDGVKAEGGFSYTGDDGQVYTVTYTADEDGFRPKGAHLPTPPPIPPEILKALEQNAKDEAAGLIDDGSYDAQKYNTAGDYSDSSDNDRYNDRQSNKVANRPGSNSPTSFSINQNNQEFKPNFNNQAGDFNKKEQTNQFQTSEVSSNLASDTTPGLINKPDITQASFFTSNRFGETNPSQNFNQQTISTSPQFSEQTFEGTLNASVNDGKPGPSQDIVIPLSQQPLQNEDNAQAAFPSGKPINIMNTIQGIQPTQTSSLVSTINNNGNIIKPFTETKPSDALNSQATIIPTNQPSRELTTPFETTVMSNVETDRKPVNTFTSQVFESATANLFTSPQAGKPQDNGQQSQLTNKFEDNIYNYNKPSLSPDTIFQKPSFQGSDDKQNVNGISVTPENALTQQPITSYDGEIYQYNKPILSQGSSNIQGFGQNPSIESFTHSSDIKQQISAIQSTPTNQPGSTYESNIYQYNKPTLHSQSTQSQSTNHGEKPDQYNKPSLQSFMLNQQTSQSSISTISGEIYNKPMSPFPNLSAQNPFQSNFMQSQLNNNQPQNLVGSVISPNSKQPVFQSTHSSFSPTKPSFASSFPIMLEQNYSIQTPNLNKDQTISENLNKRPPQSTIVQPRPTVPSFSQTIINQFRPQVPIGTYNYDVPSKSFQQPHSSSDQSRITQSAHSFGNNNKPTSQPILPSTTGQLPGSFQNNGITQASISSFAPNTGSLLNQPTNSPYNTRPSSTFAQAAASTGQFPTLPTLTPQEPMPTSQFQPSNTYDGAIYQYNKPQESFPAKPEKSEEKIIETAPLNGQLNPQFIFSIDNKGSVIEKFEFKPVSSPQGIPTLPNTPTSDQLKPDHSKNELTKEADSRPIGSTILGSACCSGHLQQNKQFGKPETNRNELNAQSLMPQEASSTIKGERFDVNRIPSTFDSTGYHY